MKKILRTIANILLVLIPFFPITENFFPIVDRTNFWPYLFLCFGLWVFMLLLIYFINNTFLKAGYALKATALLLFVLGMIVMVPLHLGPPKEGEALLQAETIERFRYALLIAAVIVLYAATYLLLKKYWKTLAIWGKLIVIPVLIGLPILLWDNYDSFSFSSQLTHWVNDGKKAADFFPQYEFHNHWRATGRIQLYIIAGWLSFILAGKSLIKKWLVVPLNLFCIAGIVFCILSVTNGMAYYFPFMVPAIAMAPAYWLGLALLNKAATSS